MLGSRTQHAYGRHGPFLKTINIFISLQQAAFLSHTSSLLINPAVLASFLFNVDHMPVINVMANMSKAKSHEKYRVKAKRGKQL